MVLEEADVYLFIGIYYAELLAVGKKFVFLPLYSFQVSDYDLIKCREKMS